MEKIGWIFDSYGYVCGNKKLIVSDWLWHVISKYVILAPLYVAYCT